MTESTRLSRAKRRALVKAMKNARRPVRRSKADPDKVPLRATPWKVRDTLEPLEQVLAGIAEHGTVDEEHGTVVFDVRGQGCFALGTAIDGLVGFFKAASKKYGAPLDTGPLERIYVAVEFGDLVTEDDVHEARRVIEEMRILAFAHLTVGEAKSILAHVLADNPKEQTERDAECHATK